MAGFFYEQLVDIIENEDLNVFGAFHFYGTPILLFDYNPATEPGTGSAQIDLYPIGLVRTDQVMRVCVVFEAMLLNDGTAAPLGKFIADQTATDIDNPTIFVNFGVENLRGKPSQTYRRRALGFGIFKVQRADEFGELFLNTQGAVSAALGDARRRAWIVGEVW